MFYDDNLYHFHISTRPKGLTCEQKILRTIYTYQRQTGECPNLGEIVRRCHYFSNRGRVKLNLQHMVAMGKLGMEFKGRSMIYWIEYEGLRDLTEIMNEYNEEHGE